MLHALEDHQKPSRAFSYPGGIYCHLIPEGSERGHNLFEQCESRRLQDPHAGAGEEPDALPGVPTVDDPGTFGSRRLIELVVGMLREEIEIPPAPRIGDDGELILAEHLELGEGDRSDGFLNRFAPESHRAVHRVVVIVIHGGGLVGLAIITASAAGWE